MDEPKISRTVVVDLPQGFHLRPASMFVKVANRYQSKIMLVKDSLRMDGRSVIELIALDAAQGTTLCIEAVGDDAESALEALAELFARNFADENP